MFRVGVLASGRGSNLEALLRWQAAGALGAEVVLVLCNRAGAGALHVAARYGIDAAVCTQAKGQDRESAQMELSARFDDRGVQLVVTAGYDRVLAPAFVQRWQGRAMNVHPSLLPAFGKSLHAQAEALQHGVKVAGCTVHFITEDVDGGPIIAQSAVPVLPDDDVATLSARILEQEHRLLPEAVRAYALGRLHVAGRKVSYAGG